MDAASRDASADTALDEGYALLGVIDAEGRFLYSTEALGTVLDAAGESVLGTSLLDGLLATDRIRLLTALADARRAAAPLRLRLEWRDRMRPSRTLDCRLARLAGADGQCVFALEVWRDREGGPKTNAPTEPATQVDSEAALKSKTAELEAILRALPDLFFRFDASGRFLDFSAPSSSALYAPPAFFLGKRPLEVMPPELAEAMERTRAKTHATGSLVTLEYELEIHGRKQYCEARYVPHLDGQTIALVRDVTDRREAEAALRASEARLRESHKLDAVGRLAGGVAHDFNNLLMIILGYATAVARHIGPRHAAMPALDEIQKAVDRATALTKQLLALSRRQPVQPTVLDVGAILDEMGSMLGRVLGEHIRFSVDVGGELGRVHADRSQLEQVILNLVLNARDAMPRGGKLSISAVNVRANQASTRPDYVALEVSDSGEGMDAETQRRMFEAFFTTKKRGTGLGLFTVQHIVQEYGGHVFVRSEPGQGTRIAVRLPTVDDTPAPVASDRGAWVGGDEVLLVVEDEEPVRALLVDVLEQLGYTVIAAADAHKALEHLARAPRIDLLLTDVVMPGASGWELAAKVVAARPDCRVLYMSGHALEGDDTRSSRIVDGELIHKPFTPNALATRLRRILER